MYKRQDKDRREYLIQNLEGKPQPWKAAFQCVVALCGPEGSPIITNGTCPGDIIPQGRGHGGFGYDRIFRLEDSGLTMAELTPDQKNQVSHRALAVQKLIPFLQILISAEELQKEELEIIN